MIDFRLFLGPLTFASYADTMHARWIGILITTCLAFACSDNKKVSPDGSSQMSPDGGTSTFNFSDETVAKGCTKALACANGSASYTDSLSDCVAQLAGMGAYDLRQDTSEVFIFNDDSDWLFYLALAQNLECVQGASGCTAILACLNQGQAQPICTAPAGYAYSRRCSDANHLRGCSLGVESSFDCSKLDLTCIETTVATASKILATCAVPVTGSQTVDTNTFEVTCQGDLAQFKFGSGQYTYNCSDAGGTCVSGSYDLSDDPNFCVGKREAACAQDFLPLRCEGDSLITCRGGHEAASDCADWGATCRQGASSSVPRCNFPCADESESCAGGVVSYCGPTGMTTLDYSLLGFSTCGLDTSSTAKATCIP